MGISNYFNLTLTHKRPSYTKDSMAGRSESLATIGTYQGRMESISANDGEYLGRDSSEQWFECFTQTNNLISTGDQITIAHNAGVISQIPEATYEIRQVDSPQTRQATHHYELKVIRHS